MDGVALKTFKMNGGEKLIHPRHYEIINECGEKPVQSSS
jgi:hypothetical protein